MLSERRIELRGVGFGYFRATPVFRGLDLVIEAGLTLVLGPNGSGKSTLLKLAAGVERPDEGAVLVNGADLWSREVEARSDLAYLPEQPDVTPYASVDAVLRLVARLRGQASVATAEALRECGLEGMERRSIRQLSKGQRHRVLLAAARIGGPSTLLLDEPLAALDQATRSLVLEWVRATGDGGGLVVVVTHEIEPFATLAARAIAMVQGRACVTEPLPATTSDRLVLLERMARGES